MKKFTGVLGIAMMVAVSSFAAEPKEVRHLIRCHEGKFDAMNAVSQLTADIDGNEVYGWSGIGATPEGTMKGESVVVRAPFTVSAPTFVQVKNVTWACVTVSKN